MYSPVLRNLSFAALLVAATILGAAASASAATQLLTNGDFETGTLEGWSSFAQPDGLTGWSTYDRAKAEESGTLPPPPSGNFAAAGLTPNGSTDANYLYQDIALPPASTDQLSMYLYYQSGSPIEVPTPNTMFASEAGAAQANQQVRVDVLKANAPIESLSPNDILATVYASRVGDPTGLAPTLLSADLTAFAGQTVRLRIAAVTQGGGLLVGVDGVSIESAPIPAPQPPPTTTTPMPSSFFFTGKLIRDLKHGGAKLEVTLPDAGTLTVADARRKLAIASARAAGNGRPIMIRTTSVQTSGPQTVRVFLRPTAAAKMLLADFGKIPFRLQLSFTPDGGLGASQSYSGLLVKKRRPVRR